MIREHVMVDEHGHEMCRVKAHSRRTAMSKLGVSDANLHLYDVVAASRFVPVTIYRSFEAAIAAIQKQGER